ncbi:ImmA/IrrE family metallo-endopeptidase [Paenibacillus spongiae]|uniref:IrrE N-terminal-like domain-containing protein n=1 Tax=Paenibacillus spongiae TaxID=2909671 RepID=A0ABY5S3Z0_9BACL|nr:ImmA/IrrE family metallo-endopeptidase [Paenibacillus spongiae]UVI28193.1 hypothetical protein L1F29_22415 [Paenibacillus spongiae]
MSSFTLDLYKPNEIELWIAKQYRMNGILSSTDMDIDRIATIFGIHVRTYDGPTFTEWLDGEYALIFLNSFQTEKKLRKAFFHELCHPLRHAGRQDSQHMSQALRDLQEAQAASFQLYASMPWYMLYEFEGFSNDSLYIKRLSEAFRLPLTFVNSRIEQIYRRISQASYDRNMSVLFSSYRSLSYRTEIDDLDNQSSNYQEYDQPLSILYKYDGFYRRDMPQYIILDTGSVNWEKTLFIEIKAPFEDSVYDELSSDQIVIVVPKQVYVVMDDDKTGCIGINMPLLKEYMENTIDFVKLGHTHTDIERLSIKIKDLEEMLFSDIGSTIQRSKLQEEWF